MSRDERGPRDPQSTLAELLRTYARPSLWFPRHPLVTWRMLLLLLRLPVVKHRPAARGHGRPWWPGPCHVRFARLTVIQQARHVLTLPTDGTPYNEGRARATQRRKARSALRLGVTSRVITDRAERIRRSRSRLTSSGSTQTRPTGRPIPRQPGAVGRRPLDGGVPRGRTRHAGDHPGRRRLRSAQLLPDPDAHRCLQRRSLPDDRATGRGAREPRRPLPVRPRQPASPAARPVPLRPDGGLPRRPVAASRPVPLLVSAVRREPTERSRGRAPGAGRSSR